MITIYTIAYNEEFILPFFIKHYRINFPDCEIIVYDNESTDNTVKIAKENNCEVISYSTNNTLSDFKYLEIKNNCWDSAKTDWVCIVDADEILDISENDLIEEEKLNTSIISFDGYNMVNMNDDSDLESICYGSYEKNYSKNYCFNKKLISEIKYAPGCHDSKPIGIINYSKERYNAYHYNFISLDRVIQKYKRNASRLSDDNIKNNYGFHYLFKEEQIKNEFLELRQKAIKLF